MPQYLLCLLMFAVSVTGAAIQAATGFGYGVFVMAVLPFLMPYGEALCSSGVVAVFTASCIAWQHRAHIDLKLTAVPVLAYCVTGLIGTMFLQGRADEHQRRILGAALLVLSLYLIFCSGRVRIGAGRLSGAAAGSVSGFMGSMFSMSGPPIVIYILAAAAGTASYIANLQVYFFFTGLYIGAVRCGVSEAGRKVPEAGGLLVHGADGGFAAARALTLPVAEAAEGRACLAALPRRRESIFPYIPLGSWFDLTCPADL